MTTKTILLACGLLLAAGAAGAQEQRGTADEAKALLGKAAAHYKAAGRDKALADFSSPQGGFKDRDLYVFCIKDGVMSAHGVNPGLIGKEIAIFKDPDGRPFIQEIYERSKTAPSGQAEYKFANPVTKKIEQKISLFENVGQDMCGVGYYKQ